VKSLQRQQVPRGTRFGHVVFNGVGESRRAIDFGHGQHVNQPIAYPVSDSPPLGPEEESFIRWLFDRAGLDARSYRVETLRRRLPACLRMLRAASVGDARQAVQQNAALVSVAVETMVIGVTSFFRDAVVVAHLGHTVLPALVRHASPATPRVWSLGCSDGAELYSVAILLSEIQMLGRAELLGTDCRPAAIARARDGVYDSSAVRDVPHAWLEQYFTPEQSRWRISESLRAVVRWRSGDATRQVEPGPWDLVLCRNLAMYLRPQVAGRLWRLLEDALRPGGFLVLGKAERPLGADRLRPVAPCIYIKA
jgi:chemotaxis protein methyltransferase CheR